MFLFVALGIVDIHITVYVYSWLQVLSDNYPERLKRLIIYPFPWYARAMWAMVKPFVDRRTQEKVVLLSDTGATGTLHLLSISTTTLVTL